MKFYKFSLIINRDSVTAAAWQLGPKGWRILRSDEVGLQTADPLPDQILAAVRPLLVKWGIPAGTPVVVVPPAGVGGVFCFSFPKAARKDVANLVDFELAKAQPFALKEIERAHRVETAGDKLLVSGMWIPRAWSNEVRNALVRAGLNLAEIFHRAQLFAAGYAPAGDDPWAFLERDDGKVNFHFYRKGALHEQTRSVGAADPSRVATEILLDLAALSLGRQKPTLIRAHVDPSLYKSVADDPRVASAVKLEACAPAPRLPELLLQLWKSGGTGIWYAPDRAVVASRMMPLALAFALLIAGVGGWIWWTALQQEHRLEELTAETKKLKPRFDRLVKLEKEYFAAVETVRNLEQATTGPTPLDPLLTVGGALPPKAWVAMFKYGPQTVQLEGYGMKADGVQRALQASGAFRKVSLAEPQVATEANKTPFAFALEWKATAPVPAAPQQKEAAAAAPGAKAPAPPAAAPTPAAPIKKVSDR